MFIKYRQNKQTQYRIDKAILEEMDKVYVTYVADVDEGQCHAVTLVCSFKENYVVRCLIWSYSYFTARYL